MTLTLAWSLMLQSQDQHVGVSRKPLREYHVCLSSGETLYILAHDSEEAAWSALELAVDRSLYLVDVRLADEW